MGRRRTARAAVILASGLQARLTARGVILGPDDRETLADAVLPLARSIALAEQLARKTAKFQGSITERSGDVLDVVAEAWAGAAGERRTLAELDAKRAADGPGSLS